MNLSQCTTVMTSIVRVLYLIQYAQSFSRREEETTDATGLMSNGWTVYASQDNLYVAQTSDGGGIGAR